MFSISKPLIWGKLLLILIAIFMVFGLSLAFYTPAFAETSGVNATTPATPSGLSATTGDGRITLSWNANTEPDIKGYYLYRNGSATPLNSTPIIATSFTDNYLSNGVSYSYQITAVNTTGYESAKSAAISATPADSTIPTSPSNLIAQDITNDNGGSIYLSWTKSPSYDVKGYNIYKSIVPGLYLGAPTYIAWTFLANPYYIDRGLTDGTTYYYKVTAIDSSGNESPPTAEVSAISVNDSWPAVPTGLIATAGDRRVTLTWNTNTDSDLAGYNIYRDGTKLNSSPVISNSYADIGLVNGTMYKYWVTAVDTVGHQTTNSNMVDVMPIGAAYNGVIFVNKDASTQVQDGRSWDTAFFTIQAGINAAAANNEVWVARGTYYERIVVKSGISLYGGFAATETTRDQRDRKQNVTIIDGEKKGSVASIGASRIDGFTIQNGLSQYDGGGVNCGAGSIVSANIIKGNKAARYGGGIAAVFGAPTISGNEITDNDAGSGDGGGIFVADDYSKIENNVIARNFATRGGGIFLWMASPGITNNTIVDNISMTDGGAIYCYGDGATIVNNIIAFCSSGIYKSESHHVPTLSHNNVYSNAQYNYGNVPVGSKDISIDPMFVDRPNGDYHLSVGSFLQDIGFDQYAWPSFMAIGKDIDGEARVQGPHVDIGADEIAPDAVPPAMPANFSTTPKDIQVILDWSDNTERDLAGYNVYRDGVKINTKPIPYSRYTDNGLPNGTTYSYEITTIDITGNESIKSGPIKATPEFIVAPPSKTERVSVSSLGEEQNGRIDAAYNAVSISADGRFVAFYSWADNLVEGDTNGTWDVFVYDRTTDKIERVSVSSTGEQGNNVALNSHISGSTFPVISGDGRYVLFYSGATNLVPNDTNNTSDIFVHDRVTRKTDRVNLSHSGVQLKSIDCYATLSFDGRYIAFHGFDDVMPGISGGIFVRDRLTGTTELVSVSSMGEPANGGAWLPSISADGRYIAFVSTATNLAEPCYPNDEIYVHDRVTKKTVCASKGLGGWAYAPAISANGGHVAFFSTATNLDPGGRTDLQKVFVYDVQANRTELVSVSDTGQANNYSCEFPSISADGRFVCFSTYSTNLVPDAKELNGKVIVRDRLLGKTELVSISNAGEQGNGRSSTTAINADGRFVAFASISNNLVDADANGTWDVFVRDRSTNSALIANDINVMVDEDSSTILSLIASDSDNNNVTYFIESAPSHGTLDVGMGQITGNQIIYKPDPNYNGSDCFTFKASDGMADSNTATVSITVNPVNDAPIVENIDVTTSEDASIDITLTASDIENGILTYSLAEGPQHGALSLITGNMVTYTPDPDYNGIDSFTFKANDGILSTGLDSNIATVSVTINSINDAPIANAGMDQTVHACETVALDGSGSSDIDGNVPLDYEWKIISRPAGSTATVLDSSIVNPSVTPDAPGDYIIQLIVTDKLGASSAADTVLISTTNSPPVADAGADLPVISIGSTVQLDGTQSYDMDGDPITYTWAILSKPVTSFAFLDDANTATPTFIADVHGDYEFALIASDPWSQSVADIVKVSFNNLPPVADAGRSQSIILGNIVTLSGSQSTDANGDYMTYKWALSAVPEGSQAAISDPTVVSPTFTPDLPGTYVAQLVVSDGFVDSEPSTVQVQVVTLQMATMQTIQEVEEDIALLTPAVFKNDSMQNALLNKLNVVLANIEVRNYRGALEQLRNDVLRKTDGYVVSGSPDKNDWITDNQSQQVVYARISEAITKLEGLLQ